MTIRTIAGAGATALLLAGAALTVTHGIAPAVASGRVDPKLQKAAADNAARAQSELSRKHWDKAIRLAEQAVAQDGQDSGYRALLGNAYLRGGRFASAEQAFADVLTLRPEDGGAALNLALARIATGRWDAARETLDAHSAAIAPADRGLALALAGDPAAAVEVLTAAARGPASDAKTRQNLALALALSGRWAEARAIAAMDMDAGAVDRRIEQWAAFAQPSSAADQVSSLLGVTPAVDPGQPVALALAGTPAVATASVDAFMPGRAAAAVESAVVSQEIPEATPVAAGVAAVAPPVAVSVPIPMIAAPAAYKVAAVKRMVATARPAQATVQARGDWVVQLGAFRNAGVAKDGWSQATRRLPALAQHRPNGVSASVKGATFYRLSVGGFTRGDAVALCRGYRAKGGVCFVRATAGDQMAAWFRPPSKGAVQLASR
ncbi:MAG: tetratricopeptide repeat protein [Sphingomonas adhaesiva]|uniref:SPOR domain-containing protein n=1 Tax=Sphingomonas adhaesiva TaxID=28212 RepID=UPI002FF60BF4